MTFFSKWPISSSSSSFMTFFFAILNCYHVQDYKWIKIICANALHNVMPLGQGIPPNKHSMTQRGASFRNTSLQRALALPSTLEVLQMKVEKRSGEEQDKPS
jgi:hypothetical protein